MEHSLYVDEGRMEPLQIGILAALTPSDIDVAFYDDRMEEILYDAQTDLVAITVEIFTARRAYEIADEFRKRGVPVVLGGIHVHFMPEETALHADSIVIGDAESIWKELIADFKNHCLKPSYQGNQPRIPQEGIITRRALFEKKGYLPITLLQFSRGCEYGCNFCASSAYFDQKHYTRKIEEVIDEIKSQKRKLLFFVDDNIICNFEKAKELFRALIPLKIRWVSQASINMLEDKELMNLMVKSGCIGHVIGFESINEDSLQSANKKINLKKSFDKYKDVITQLRDYGLQTWAAFTLGYDWDTVESIRETCNFAIENKFCFAAFNILMPYPKTKFYQKLQQENRLLYDGKWWLHPEYRFNCASFVPKNMPADVLTSVTFECRKKFNGLTSFFSRAFEFKTNMRTPYHFLTYLTYNPLFRKEVFKKQGLFLGKENHR